MFGLASAKPKLLTQQGIDKIRDVRYNKYIKSKEVISMKTIIIVRNTTTAETYTYDRTDLFKARIAVDYLSTTTSYLWYLERVQVEA